MEGKSRTIRARIELIPYLCKTFVKSSGRRWNSNEHKWPMVERHNSLILFRKECTETLRETLRQQNGHRILEGDSVSIFSGRSAFPIEFYAGPHDVKCVPCVKMRP